MSAVTQEYVQNLPKIYQDILTAFPRPALSENMRPSAA
jgi:hypothetical protein